jgi:hypothetical protein
MNRYDQRVSEETLSEFYNALTKLINEYLHSFRCENHMRDSIPYEITDIVRKNILEYSKTALDQLLNLIIEAQQNESI